MNKDKKWIVAVSGGPDSMVLMDLLRLSGYKIVVAHVNYKKRETSDRDEAIVSEYCKKYGLPFEIVNYNDDVQGTNNFQHNARIFRYAFFKTLVSKYEAAGVAVGHHLDDDIETYLIQKNRHIKSTFIGLSEFAKVLGVNVWRPMLSWRKADILTYATNNDLTYGIDESNFADTYTRNRIRQNLENLNVDEWNKIVDAMHKDRESNNIKQAKLNNSLVNMGNTVSSKVFLTHEHSQDLLRYWLREQNIDVNTMSERHLEGILEGIKSDSYEASFGELELSVSYGQVNVSAIESYSCRIDSVAFRSYDKFKITDEGSRVEAVRLRDEDFPITIRYAKPEDEIQMKYGTKKLNRFFIDRKIPRFRRKKWLVIENSAKEVVFVVGLGCDVHHYANNNNIFVIEL